MTPIGKSDPLAEMTAAVVAGFERLLRPGTTPAPKPAPYVLEVTRDILGPQADAILELLDQVKQSTPDRMAHVVRLAATHHANEQQRLTYRRAKAAAERNADVALGMRVTWVLYELLQLEATRIAYRRSEWLETLSVGHLAGTAGVALAVRHLAVAEEHPDGKSPHEWGWCNYLAGTYAMRAAGFTIHPADAGIEEIQW